MGETVKPPPRPASDFNVGWQYAKLDTDPQVMPVVGEKHEIKDMAAANKYWKEQDIKLNKEIDEQEGEAEYCLIADTFCLGDEPVPGLYEIQKPGGAYRTFTILRMMDMINAIMCQTPDAEFFVESMVAFSEGNSFRSNLPAARQRIEKFNLNSLKGFYGVANTGKHWIVLGFEVATGDVIIFDSW